MPHITINLWPGRTEEQKKKCVKAVAESMVDTMDGLTDEKMSVSIMEIPPEEWDEKINGSDKVNKGEVFYIISGQTRDEWCK